MNVTTSTDAVAMWDLVAHASLLVQLVLLLLFSASVVSWTMIFRKWFALRAAFREAQAFEDKFWSGVNANQLYVELSRQEGGASGMSAIFIAGFKEYSRLDKQRNLESAEVLEGVQRVMRVALSREVEQLDTSLPFLATVGSISPYVGLFGTVWGIMNAFRALGNAQQVTLQHVAPGIAEALIATAFGLFAAIPAVIAYNRFSNRVERLLLRYENFVEEFASILHRQVAAVKA